MAVGTTFKHESILPNYYTTEHNFPLRDQHSDIQALKTNLLIRKPADIDIIITRSSSTMVTKMAAPIKIRGCVVTTVGVSPVPVGTSKCMIV